MIGETYGRLTIIGDGGRNHINRPIAHCQCACGRELTTLYPNLRNGHTRSCGCISREVTTARNLRHGLSKTPIHNTWLNMRARCHSPSASGYHKYGARGISVCERWRNSFDAFLADVGPKPSPRHSLERINNDGHYEPGNVRWATATEQARNRRSSHVITVNGVSRTVAEWTERMNVNHWFVRNRLRRGWSEHDAVTVPPKRKTKARS